MHYASRQNYSDHYPITHGYHKVDDLIHTISNGKVQEILLGCKCDEIIFKTFYCFSTESPV
jgi:hypothetical protein